MKRVILQLLCGAGIAGTSMVSVGSAQSAALSGPWTGTVAAKGSSGEQFNLVALNRFTFDHRVGRFLMTRDAGTTGAQTPAGGMDPASALKQGFAEVSGWLLRAAEMVPPDKYSYRPAPTVRTFGEMLGHVADGYNYFCGRASGQKVEWSDAVAQGKTDKATIAAALKASTSACATAHDGKAAGSPLLLQNFGHTSLHYGNVVTYMRMLGLVPPSS